MSNKPSRERGCKKNERAWTYPFRIYLSAPFWPLGCAELEIQAVEGQGVGSPLRTLPARASQLHVPRSSCGGASCRGSMCCWRRSEALTRCLRGSIYTGPRAARHGSTMSSVCALGGLSPPCFPQTNSKTSY